MDFNRILEQEISLDPENWEEVKDLGQHMIEDIVHQLRFIADQPVWRKPTPAMKAFLAGILSEEGQALKDIYEQYKNYIRPYPKGNIHPRFWSWVQGTGSLTAVYADMLASALNSNVAIGDHAAMYVEGQVIDWCKSMMGFPDTASGILLSGGSMANITGLIVARNAYDQRIRRQGIQVVGKPMVFYASEETHGCQQRAAEIMGLGADALRKVPVDENYKIRIEVLKQMIEEDLRSGFAPFAVVANAGTVNTGAIDPLTDIEKICREYQLWFHVDGAFGALAKLTPEYHESLNAIERADSLAFDLHKWMYLPYEIGCLLVKDKDLHRGAFAQQPNYLLSHERGLPAGPDPISNYGMELSRGFKALKAWFCFQEHGLEKYRKLIRQNIAQCKYLEAAILRSPDLELMAPVELNIVCFRYIFPGAGADRQNALNKELLMRLQEEAIAAPSYTFIKNQYSIRVANVNHRSKKSDFDALIEGVLKIGHELQLLHAD